VVSHATDIAWPAPWETIRSISALLFSSGWAAERIRGNTPPRLTVNLKFASQRSLQIGPISSSSSSSSSSCSRSRQSAFAGFFLRFLSTRFTSFDVYDNSSIVEYRSDFPAASEFRGRALHRQIGHATSLPPPSRISLSRCNIREWMTLAAIAPRAFTLRSVKNRTADSQLDLIDMISCAAALSPDPRSSLNLR